MIHLEASTNHVIWPLMLTPQYLTVILAFVQCTRTHLQNSYICFQPLDRSKSGNGHSRSIGKEEPSNEHLIVFTEREVKLTRTVPVCPVASTSAKAVFSDLWPLHMIYWHNYRLKTDHNSSQGSQERWIHILQLSTGQREAITLRPTVSWKNWKE